MRALLLAKRACTAKRKARTFVRAFREAVEVSGNDPESKEKCVSVSTLRRTSDFV